MSTSRKTSSSRFIDQARIFVKAGDGGDGAVAFRREKFVPRGGPDGGDGGRGGDVLLRAEPGLRTLVDCVLRHRYEAPNGKRGGSKRRRGADGEDLIIRVPAGTMVYADEDGALLADLTAAGQVLLAAKGGKGGRGNSRFATPTHRTPRFAESGDAGQARWLRLELRILADVGVIGLPNAGKSTLISRLSAARPKIASYPFTTLSPTLGVVRADEERSFVLADMPGLIEGAHSGQGLGHDFLRHIERTRLLVHMLDISLPERDPLSDLETVNRELRLHRSWLAEMPQIIALNKIDLPEAKEALPQVKEQLENQSQKIIPISALGGEGLEALVKAIVSKLEEAKEDEAVSEGEEMLIDAAPGAPLEVRQTAEGVFLVKGEEVERQARMLDPENREAMTYLHRRLGRMGVLQRLVALGAKRGDRIVVAGRELEYKG
ncbi:MAG: GTPase ObgE [Armatimonadetes bacterium]|nr:GTPase ObgE [Armatimonadota bacterium]NIM24001.1 GTPase ObgE [Armatimonadota bacterium]NIM67851.1 GTPase ObgE [Armatimonadota bacterium]NIM76382.1 GTPase ObgE [Armatimonadota bacterium]NIN06081.1 GTPase ObgE [Armatimonadota bacterium]